MGKKRSANEAEADDGGSGAARAIEGSDKGVKEKRVLKEKSKEGNEKAVKPEVVVAEVPGQGKVRQPGRGGMAVPPRQEGGRLQGRRAS